MQTFFATLFLLPLCFGWVLPPPCLHSTRLSGSILPKDFKNGLTIEIDGQPSKIVEFSHSKQARGAASTNARFKNLITGATLTKTIRAAESFDPAPIDKVQAQHTYQEGGSYFFMDMESFEEIMCEEKIVGEYKDWFMEGMEVQLVKFGDKVIDFVLPDKVELEVVECEPNFKGNKDAVTKPAKLSCGATITIPGFIEQGDMILVDMNKKNYISRAEKTMR